MNGRAHRILLGVLVVLLGGAAFVASVTPSPSTTHPTPDAPMVEVARAGISPPRAARTAAPESFLALAAVVTLFVLGWRFAPLVPRPRSARVGHVSAVMTRGPPRRPHVLA